MAGPGVAVLLLAASLVAGCAALEHRELRDPVAVPPSPVAEPSPPTAVEGDGCGELCVQPEAFADVEAPWVLKRSDDCWCLRNYREVGAQHEAFVLFQDLRVLHVDFNARPTGVFSVSAPEALRFNPHRLAQLLSDLPRAEGAEVTIVRLHVGKVVGTEVGTLFERLQSTWTAPGPPGSCDAYLARFTDCGRESYRYRPGPEVRSAEVQNPLAVADAFLRFKGVADELAIDTAIHGTLDGPREGYPMARSGGQLATCTSHESVEYQAVLREALEYERAWNRSCAPTQTARLEAGVPPPPRVDFGRHMVVAVFWGEKASGGYIQEVGSGALDDGTLVIPVDRSSPGPSCMTTQSFTFPGGFHVMPRHEGPVRFAFREDVHAC